MRIRITVTQEFDLGDKSPWCTTVEYKDLLQTDPDRLCDIFEDAMHSAVMEPAKWKIVELRKP